LVTVLVLLGLLGLLSLVLLCACGDLYVLLCEDADYAGGDFMMNYSLVIFPDDVYPKFLGNHVFILPKKKKVTGTYDDIVAL
jgi:hypothetical protein